MRYFLRAAGNTFQVGSSRLTLKLFKVSELSCRPGLAGARPELEVSAPPCVDLDFSEVFEVEGSDDEPPFRLLGISCSARCGEGWGDSTTSILVGDFCGLVNCAHWNEGCLRKELVKSSWYLLMSGNRNEDRLTHISR